MIALGRQGLWLCFSPWGSWDGARGVCSQFWSPLGCQECPGWAVPTLPCSLRAARAGASPSCCFSRCPIQRKWPGQGQPGLEARPDPAVSRGTSQKGFPGSRAAGNPSWGSGQLGMEQLNPPAADSDPQPVLELWSGRCCSSSLLIPLQLGELWGAAGAEQGTAMWLQSWIKSQIALWCPGRCSLQGGKGIGN